MAKLIYPTTRKLTRPLLVDTAQLAQLDLIIDENIDGLRQARDKELHAKVEEDIAEARSKGKLKAEDAEKQRLSDLKYWKGTDTWSEEKRTITIYLSKGREIEAQRFSEAIVHSQSQDEIPLGFLIYLKVGPVTAHVDLHGAWGDDLMIKVKPSEWEKSQELFGLLVNWARDVEPPWWQQMWLKASGVFGAMLLFLVMFGFVIIPLVNRGDGAKEMYKQEARKLLERGINPGSQQRALELLLAIESDYDPGTPRKPMGIKYWSYVLLSAIFLLIGTSSPSLALGFWKGREQLARWRIWIRIVTVTIPTLLLTFIAIPWLLYWLHLAPPNS
ncbi:MAG TPA: hypothetical protein VFI38_09800 [Candidatus Acidoferrum sp.]|nr:hypothetical protein [Candidatus Acidoferrum sp.]